MKIVMLCDAETHFMCNALPYLGKGSVQLPRNIKTHGEFYLTELVKPYPDPGRTVTSDNWFTTLKGATHLTEKGLHFVGTIKDKPYLPKALTEAKIDIGESIAVFNYENEVTLLCHRANKTKKVQLISTLHNNPSVIEKKKTDIQMFYNATKGGVDTFDQLCSKTSCIRMTNRWTLCFFFGVINLAYTNTYILHQVNKTKKQGTLSRREFGMKLGEQLCKPWAMKRLQIASIPRELRVLIGSVFNVVCDYLPDSTPEAARTRKRCYMCPPTKNIRTKQLCSRCSRPTCPRHEVLYCGTCDPGGKI